ncbi:hypothetical protein HN51_014094 [Arachis hypogaea]
MTWKKLNLGATLGKAKVLGTTSVIGGGNGVDFLQIDIFPLFYFPSTLNLHPHQNRMKLIINSASQLHCWDLRVLSMC